jgi:hypothetical protein
VIDQPDQLDAGVEVVPDLAGHLRPGVSFAEQFNGQIRREVRNRLSGAFTA